MTASSRWRLGAFGLTPPAEIAADNALEWAIERAATLDVEIIGGDHRSTFRWGTFKCDRGYWRELRGKAAERGLEIEPYVRSPFDVVGVDAEKARAALVESIRASKDLGGPVLRTAYGDQTVARTRFAPRPLAEHLDSLKANLKEAAKIAQSEDIVFAVENHTDFSGRDWDAVFSDVDSEHVRCAVDTGNGLTIFSDPAEDAAALARWAVTTHIKDMRVIENPRPAVGMSPQVPFGLVGCPIGEGNIDLRAIVRRLVSASPLQDRLPLIVEPSWPSGATQANLADRRNALVETNVENLRRMVREMEDPPAHG
jgi:sugar phosphate isomerase/epimerase